jgi:hypothetical protein
MDTRRIWQSLANATEGPTGVLDGTSRSPAERADLLIDFSRIPANTSFILYNDAPAPFPGGDPRNDYFTGDPDQTAFGGAPTTHHGKGPNTRTVMKVVVGTAIGSPLPNLTILNTALRF